MADAFVIKQIYANEKAVDQLPDNGTGYIFDKSECSNGAQLYYDWNPYSQSYEMNIFYNKLSDNSNKAYAAPTECSVYFVSGAVGPSDGTNGENNYNNPNTGAFISYVFILGVIIAASIVIYYTIKKRKFYRV